MRAVPRVALALAPASLSLLVALHAPLAAQAPSGRLEGQLVVQTETKPGAKAATRPANGATIEATRVQPEPALRFEASADERGRYRFDTLPPGEYALHATTPLLDSLELTLADRAVTVVAGENATADFVVPTGAALRDAVCPGLPLGTGRGVVAGHATDADTERPLVGAIVVVGWKELVVDRSTVKATNEERVANVVTGDRGAFRLCGVPTGTSLMLQLQQGELASAVVTLAVPDEEGAVARDLSMSVGDSAVTARADSMDHVSVRGLVAPPPKANGQATLVGTVRGVGGQPLANTDLRVEGASSSAVSDASGRYSIANLPAGSQMLVARHIGYEAVSLPVELRAGKSFEREVRLSRVVSLDSIRVVAMRSQYPDFEFDRKSNPFGVYLGPEEIERRRSSETSELFVGLPGVTVQGHGDAARVVSVHGRNGARPCEGMTLYVDGHPDGRLLNDIAPSTIGAIEIFNQGAFSPALYAVRGSCGVIVVWTRSARRARAATRPERREDTRAP